jgi:FSR family fosmidomycin resistance protein-like MFS transporter
VVKLRERGTRPTRAGSWTLLAALAVVLVDELVDGTKSAALPLMRRDLHLTYDQVGLLASVPLLLGSVLELPLGVLAGHGRRRRLAVLGGGVLFVLALVAAATARSFAGLLVAVTAFFPASGAFVGLTQSGLMDADPARREQHMARWDLAGSVGQVAGPLLLAIVLAASGGWRSAYLALALCAVAAWLGVARAGPGIGGSAAAEDPAHEDQGRRGGAAAARRVAGALRRPGVVRWLVLIQVCDLLLDILTGFLGLYLVDVVHATNEQAALGVAIRLGAGLAGDAVLVQVLERVAGLKVLRASVIAAALLYPAFLLVPGLWPKLAVLACLTIATAPWYAVLQAQLYHSLPGQSGIVVSLSSAATLLGGAVPLAVGLLAERFGLSWALASLAAAPLCLLAGLWRRSSGNAKNPDISR